MTFGKRLKKARTEKRMTQKQLADLLSVKHNSISNWENDINKPDPDTIELICGILEITPNFLLATSTEAFSPAEKLIIKKYRELDPHGKKMVDFTLQEEWERSKEEKETVQNLPTKLCPHLHLLQNYGKSLIASITDVITLKDVDSLKVYDDIKHLIRKIINDKSYRNFSEREATYFITEFVLAITYRDIILDNNWFADIYTQCCYITNHIPTNELTKLFNLNLSLNAAHERTDIEVTDEMKEHDDAFFDEED